MDKRGIVTHPVWLFIFGLILGIVIIALWAEGYINIPFPFGRG